LWKEVKGTRTNFHYSNEGLIGEYDRTGNEIKTYGYRPNSTWTTDPVFMKVGSEYYWYQNDHAGTPQKLIATNGLVVWDGKYDSFSNCQIEIDAVTNNLRFAGQYYDAETGLHYNLNRYYDPQIGRYLRADPFGDENIGLLNFHGKSEIDFRAGTLKSGLQASVAQLQWRGDNGPVSNTTGLYHWNAELGGGITNIGTLGGIEAKAKIAAFEGKTVSKIRIGSIYIKGTLGGTLGSLGLEGQVGTRGIKIGLHAIIGATVGLEWGFVNKK
jgi:RHS repeat-associated protein